MSLTVLRKLRYHWRVLSWKKCVDLWMLQALAIIAIIVAILFCENKSPPPPHYAIYLFLTETHHFEVEASTSREKWLACRSSANTRCSVAPNNRRTMTILSTARRTLSSYLLFTCRQKHFRTCLPWDVLLCQREVRLACARWRQRLHLWKSTVK